MKVNIPNPCSEKYDNMTPTDLGMLCKVCNTEVVDFKNWETKDIIDYIKKSNKKVCGRLNISASSPKYNWRQFAATLLTIGSLGTSTNLKAASVSNYSLTVQDNQKKDSVTLIILNQKNSPIAEVNVRNINEQTWISNKDGKVFLPITSTTESYKILILGYHPKEIKVNKKKTNQTIKIVMEEASTTIGEVIIEPSTRIRPTLNEEINAIHQLEPQKISPSTTQDASLKKKIKRLFNIFSTKDED